MLILDKRGEIENIMKMKNKRESKTKFLTDDQSQIFLVLCLVFVFDYFSLQSANLSERNCSAERDRKEKKDS